MQGYTGLERIPPGWRALAVARLQNPTIVCT